MKNGQPWTSAGVRTFAYHSDLIGLKRKTNSVKEARRDIT